MSQLSIPVLDADGHVTESYQQIAKYLDEPWRRRPHTFPWYTADGWDRRLVDKCHDWAGNAGEWLRALDRGGMGAGGAPPDPRPLHELPQGSRLGRQALPRLRMDDEYAKRAEEAPALRKRPSEYVRSGSIYFSCEADEWLLPQAVKLCGENQIVYASDFPHWDHSFPGSIDEINDRGDITDAQKRKILADDTRRLYGLKP